MESERQRNIRHLWFFGNEFYLLQRLSERYIEGAPVEATREEAAEYVEPFINELAALRESINATRIKLRQFGVAIPRAWCNPPIALASKRNEESDLLELDRGVVAQWAAICDEVDAIIEEMTYAPETPPPPPPPPAPISVDLAKKTVTVNGEPIDVASELALRWIKVLAAHPGEWIPAPDLVQYDSQLDGARPDKFPTLPNKIAVLIESKRAAGSRLKFPVA